MRPRREERGAKYHESFTVTRASITIHKPENIMRNRVKHSGCEINIALQEKILLILFAKMQLITLNANVENEIYIPVF